MTDGVDIVRERMDAVQRIIRGAGHFWLWGEVREFNGRWTASVCWSGRSGQYHEAAFEEPSAYAAAGWLLDHIITRLGAEHALPEVG